MTSPDMDRPIDILVLSRQSPLFLCCSVTVLEEEESGNLGNHMKCTAVQQQEQFFLLSNISDFQAISSHHLYKAQAWSPSSPDCCQHQPFCRHWKESGINLHYGRRWVTARICTPDVGRKNRRTQNRAEWCSLWTRAAQLLPVSFFSTKFPPSLYLLLHGPDGLYIVSP